MPYSSGLCSSKALLNENPTLNIPENVSMSYRKTLHPILFQKRIFSDESYESKIKKKIKYNGYKNPRKGMCCLEVGFALCLAVGGVIAFLPVPHPSAIWKKDRFELFRQRELMLCGSSSGRCGALLRWVTGGAGLPSSCKQVIYLITWKKGNCQVTMVMFPTLLFYGRVYSKAEIFLKFFFPGLLLQKCQICPIQSF